MLGGMESLGNRIRHIRDELGLSQRKLARLTGLDQGRLSRIENGALEASVEVIDKIAAALERSGRDLAAGTDREGHYFAQGLTPEQAAREREQQALSHDFDVLLFEAIYERIVALFESVHTGPFITVNIDGGEAIYLDLLSALSKTRVRLDGAPDVYLPKHLELTSDDEALAWDEWEQPELRRSLLEVRKFVHEQHPSEMTRNIVLQCSPMPAVDKAIADIREFEREQNAQWLKRVEAAAKRGLP